MLPVSLLSGALFTLTGTALQREAGSAVRTTGLLAFANTAGGMLGSLAGAFVPLAWFLAGFDFIAYPFDRRAMKLRRKLGIALRNLPTTLGFGLAVSLMLLPVVTLPFAAPCAVAGAALLFPGGRRRGAPSA